MLVQEEHAYRYRAVDVLDSGAPAPACAPPPPPQRRRMSPCRYLIRAFIAVCTFIGLLSLLVWLIYLPRAIQVAVDSATLSRFTLNTTASPPELAFDLTAGVVISNPSKRAGVYYDQLQAVGFYRGGRFGGAALPVSFQGARQVDPARATVLAGRSDDGFWGSVAGAFGDDNGTGAFPVDLLVGGTVQYRFGELMTTSASMLSVKCPLVLQLMVPSSRVECVVVSF